MIKLGVSGACGKMGSRIISLAGQDQAFKVVLALEREGCDINAPRFFGPPVTFDPAAIADVDVFIEFTTPDATLKNLELVEGHKKAAVIGTTGLAPEQIKTLQQASKNIPIVFSPNMAVGVNVLFEVLPQIAGRLGPDYNIEIVEAHHAAKQDAPSGTAKKMAQLLTEASGKSVPAHSVRLGDIVGDHTIIFCGNSERIEIKHQAHSRDLFALGALRAAKWIFGKPAGLYSLRDVLK